MNATSTPRVTPDSTKLPSGLKPLDQIVKAGTGSSHGHSAFRTPSPTMPERGSASMSPTKLQTRPYKEYDFPVEGLKFPIPATRALERRIKSLIRWNAMAMVHRQNK